MEPNDEVVERQKLVPNDVETEEEPTSQVNTAPQSAPKSAPTPSSPVAVPKINLKSLSSCETRSRASCSIERTTSEKGQASAKVTYINERRQKSHHQIGDDSRFEYKSRPRKLLKDVADGTISNINLSNIAADGTDNNCNPTSLPSESNKKSTAASVVASIAATSSIQSNNNNSIRLAQSAAPSSTIGTSTVPSPPPPPLSLQLNNNSDKFDDRPIKHHSFVSEVPDVKHMERALLGLLDDFHSGKLKAFGSGCTMDQMTKIREQQESLAKLHFELAAAEEDLLENGNDFNAAKAQENMLQLVQRLEQLSVSIEQLQTSHNCL